ncbi:helix-turn-helix domain-containing protein [Kordia sp. YSTF-M3]|uniref:Helix-turn-helix domain-containing protein n=1 Tax=Kordia aestuariivivens TaxID=2759037 RepID=A0ABR7QAG0_9FLAO|nr:helix-turn-helix domain-containing protein [Kordia aestuariivivens]MBC8755564.1 helix-turn-helix domain-containing protein [Kordia aestuariivivens]
MNLYKFLSFVFLFFYLGVMHSQERDSLIHNSYAALKNQYKSLEYTNPKSAIIYAEALLLKAKKERNTLEEHVAFLLKASSENYFGNMDVSLQYIDSSILYATAQKNDSLLIKALSQKGKTYFTYGKYTNAITYYLQLDSLAKVTKNIRYQIYSNHSIGSIKNLTGNHKEATELFLKNKDIITPLLEEKKYHTVYLNTLIGLCSAYTYHDIDAASSYLPELKNFSIAANDTDALSYYFTLKGIVDYKRKKYDDALAVLDQADSLITLLGTKRNLFPVYRFRGKVYFDKKQYSNAIVAFEAIKSLQSEVKFDHFEFKEILSLLAISYEQLEDNEKALENYRLAHNLSYVDTLQESIRYTILKKYDKKTLEDKILSLKTKSDQKEKQNTSLVFVCIGLFTALTILFFVYRKQQQHNKRKFDQLVQQLASNRTTTEPTHKFQISDEKVSKILTGLEKFEKANLFLNKNTSLASVAKKLNTNTSYLSEIVNTHKGVTFKNHITQLRISYALNELKNDKVLRSYSIKAIAKELGFKSEGAFSRAFKKQTGIYPSFFIKNLAAIS